MSSSRPVVWVSPVVYSAVLVAGLYAGFSGLGDTSYALFLGGLAALFGLDLWERRRYPGSTPRLPAAVLLALRAALFIAVATSDGSGLSRAMFVLLPFTAYFAFGRLTSLLIAAGCLGLIGVGWETDIEHISDLLMFALGLLLAVAMAAVAVEERQGRERIAQLSAAAERNRLARDIHDDLGHHLTAVVVLLEKASAFRDRDPAAAQRAHDDASRSARQALDEVRQSVRALRHDTVPFDLSSALRQLVNPDVSLKILGSHRGYQETALETLYRAAQEGITNARRHANAANIGVTVRLGPAQAELVVADDGVGFSPGTEGFGLRGMRERVELVGGRLDVQSGPSSGTHLMIVIPRQVAT